MTFVAVATSAAEAFSPSAGLFSFFDLFALFFKGHLLLNEYYK
ncbi:hypothetical protein MPF_1924 [Methanohalophilus portucalensis FDF-1]|uniref:Uncharacterized protein n=1 Tax=Methanohalophilus portucalensis FDF-1 TaxID=523843 RepID=A0A1L9C266_9EURY|nr:hypothetical protein MPF_1924 [Methanohalophilus portucalensis FDF-1]